MRSNILENGGVESTIQAVEAWHGNIDTVFDLVALIGQMKSLASSNYYRYLTETVLTGLNSADGFRSYFLLEHASPEFPVWAIDHKGDALVGQQADHIICFEGLANQLSLYINTTTGQVQPWFAWESLRAAGRYVPRIGLTQVVRIGEIWASSVDDDSLRAALAGAEDHLRQYGGSWAQAWSDPHEIAHAFSEGQLCRVSQEVLAYAIESNGASLQEHLPKIAWLVHRQFILPKPAVPPEVPEWMDVIEHRYPCLSA